ncbi:MAG: amidase [Myxococcales bacterium]|nr:amidase [Myxococcales bacterium]MDH5565805.1 amidase [Myxococcales bacterium]
MDDRELCYLPATQALAHFRSRELSPVELLGALIRRSEEVEPKINAFTERYFEEALAQAAVAEQRYARRASDLRLLEGLPVAIKDEPEIAGKRTTQGSLLLKDFVSERSAYIVERLAEAGAIFHARTATPEFCLLFQTHSRLWGVTRNPWNLEITPGGSSGGSAASLAAGTSPLASGSDIGGSIRQPASMCGLVGFKPPYGRVPEVAPINLDPFCHQGPLARNVADCALMQNAISGRHPCDIASVREKVEIPLQHDLDLRGWRVAYSIDFGYVEVDTEVARNTERALDVLRAQGAVVEEVKLGWTSRLDRIALKHWDLMMGGYIRKLAEGRRELLTDYATDYVERVGSYTADDLLEEMDVCGELYDQFGPLMERYDVFVCPNATTTDVKADFNYLHDRITINGKEVHPEIDVAMNHHFNMLSRCPVLAVPSGVASNGVPTGIQIVGKAYDDVSVFRTAAALEAAAPRFSGDATRPAL